MTRKFPTPETIFFIRNDEQVFSKLSFQTCELIVTVSNVNINSSEYNGAIVDVSGFMKSG